MNLFRHTARYNPAAATYLERVEQFRKAGKKIAMNFLSPSNMQLLLTTVRQMIVQQVAKSLQKHNTCSIIAHGT